MILVYRGLLCVAAIVLHATAKYYYPPVADFIVGFLAYFAAVAAFPDDKVK